MERYFLPPMLSYSNVATCSLSKSRTLSTRVVRPVASRRGKVSPVRVRSVGPREEISDVQVPRRCRCCGLHNCPALRRARQDCLSAPCTLRTASPPFPQLRREKLCRASGSLPPDPLPPLMRSLRRADLILRRLADLVRLDAVVSEANNTRDLHR